MSYSSSISEKDNKKEIKNQDKFNESSKSNQFLKE